MTAPARAAVVDLRQYTLHPGRRDDLIALFEAHFVDGQEAAGMHVVGQFRDLDDPDRFVWLRAFDSLPARADALAGFYYGPVWRAHREQANATLVDSDDALLLNPVHLGAGYPRYGTPRADGTADSLVHLSVLYRDRPVDAEFRALVLDEAVPELAAAGGEPLAVFVTDPSANNFPALPLREENVIAWISRFAGDAEYAAYQERLAQRPAWRDGVLPALERTVRARQQLRLRPTGRSHLR